MIDLEMRATEVGGRRYVSGRILPYNVISRPVLIKSRNPQAVMPEMLVSGAVEQREADIELLAGHSPDGEFIGVSEEVEYRDDGVYGKFLLSTEPVAVKWFNRVKDGVAKYFSAEFATRAAKRSDRVIEKRNVSVVQPGGALLMRVALVTSGGYGKAVLASAETRESRIYTPGEELEPVVLTPVRDELQDWLESRKTT